MVAVDIIFAPVFLSVLVYLLTRNNEHLAKYIALGWFVVLFFISLNWYNNLPQEGFLELGTFLEVPQFGFDLTLRVDALSIAMLILTAALLILVVFTSWEEKNQAAYFSLLIMFSGPIFGVFMTTNVLWFFMFWELTLCSNVFFSWLLGSRKKNLCSN